jgi:hypothetical protein
MVLTTGSTSGCPPAQLESRPVPTSSQFADINYTGHPLAGKRKKAKRPRRAQRRVWRLWVRCNVPVNAPRCRKPWPVILPSPRPIARRRAGRARPRPAASLDRPRRPAACGKPTTTGGCGVFKRLIRISGSRQGCMIFLQARSHSSPAASTIRVLHHISRAAT